MGKSCADRPFELSFLDENLNQQYANEVYWFRVLSHSALVAVLLSCLGLFGLVSPSSCAADKGDWDTEGTGGFCPSCDVVVFQRFY